MTDVVVLRPTPWGLEELALFIWFGVTSIHQQKGLNVRVNQFPAFRRAVFQHTEDPHGHFAMFMQWLHDRISSRVAVDHLKFFSDTKEIEVLSNFDTHLKIKFCKNGMEMCLELMRVGPQ